MSRHHLFLVLFSGLLLLSEVLGNGSFLVTPAYATGTSFSAGKPASLTFQQFLKMGGNTKFYHGPLVRQASFPNPHNPHVMNTANLPPSAEPVTMKPISQSLDSAFLTGSSGTPSLDLAGSDGRLEVQVAPGSLDLSHAAVAGGATPSGALTLQMSEVSGHFIGASNLLGTYQMQIIDSKGRAVSGIQLRAPLTIVYHYQSSEMDALNLDSGHLLLTWPTLIAAARQAKQPTTDLILSLHNDPIAHTLTAHSNVSGPGPFSLGGDANNQAPPVPNMASVQGNTGQLSYGYPLLVPPGVAGFAPQLSLDYSSSGPNSRSNLTSPAENMGDGWSLSLGAITADVYPSGSASAKTWYFISGVDNVSDRLVQDSSLPYSGTFYDTQHLSYLVVQQVNSSQTGQICFHVWDKSGTYYEFGCTTDALQYSTDSGGTRHNYRWDVNKIVAPNEGQSANNSYKIIDLTYKRDSVTTNNHTTIRDSGIQQIIYGDEKGATDPPLTDVAGTVDFTYLAPPYSTNYNCASSPPTTTTLRCDDPLNMSGGLAAPTVMSTLTLQSVTSYVGADTGGKPAYGYNFTYTDNPFQSSTDPTTGTSVYIAGEHLLTQIQPVVYQQGAGHNLPVAQFNYSPAFHATGNLQNTYYDSAHYPFGSSAGKLSTGWQYLTSYIDTNSGVGASIQYATAYNNTNGTPYRTDSKGNIADDRHDPLYCFKYAADCSGNYAHPDQWAWSLQVVTQIQASGKDSSALTSFATTTYSYTLAITGEYKTGTGACYPYPSPGNYQPGQNDCVGDNWIPASSGINDSDWGDYYHAEYRGFASVALTGPHGDLTVDNYPSTEGWGTPDADFANYGAGALMSEYVYQGGKAVSTALLHDATNYYAGGPLITNPLVTGKTACVSASATDTVYTPCEVMALNAQTFEVNGASGTQPSVENDFTYDDYSSSSGWVSGGYHQLQQQVTTSSDAPAFTRKWTYYTNAAVGGSWTTYNVESVKHSEVDDSGTPVHIWQCQFTTYDEGSGVTTPSAGWPTTLQTYSNSNCGSPGPNNTITTNYLGYDAFGNAVATVDGVAKTNSSVYSSNGCALSRPTIFTATSNWATNLNYTTCITYDSHNAQPTKVTYPLAPPSSPNLSTSVSYDDTQGSLPVSSTDMNGQVTTTSYSYTNGNLTTQELIPPDTSGYTTRTSTNTSCPGNNTQPCFEIDSNTSQYSAAFSSTISDALGRVVETSTPGPDPANPAPGKSYFTVVLTEYKDDTTHSIWQSNPFVVAVPTTQQSPGWIDPTNAVDYSNNPPGGSVTFYDALGRPIAFDDPIFVANGSSGISCPSLGSNATSCTLYGLGKVSGSDPNTYAQVTNIDPNNHVTTSYVDILGRVVYGQLYSGAYGSATLTEQKAVQYNVLSEPTQVKVIDEAQIGTPSITTTASYDDLGRLTTLNDPDRGTHNYTYDADGRLLTDASSLVTLGYSYDLMGRLGCVQDQPPPSPVSPTGACSTSGVNPFAQYTYDVSAPGANWSGSDYPKGRLTQTYAINYFPGPDFTQGKVTEQTQYDARGRAINENLLVTATGGTLTFPTFPTYKLNLQYNDANQVTSAQTSSSPSGLGYTAAPIYDSMTGVEVGLGTTISTSPNVASVTYNAQALISNINFLANATTTVAAESFQYDGDLRPTSANACWQTACTTPPACPTAAFFCQGLGYDAASNIINLSTTQATVPGTTNSGGSETQVFCYDEQNRLVWAGNTTTQPASCSGNGTPANTLNNAAYHAAYSFNNLGQITSGPYNGTGATQQYLYCDSTHPHALTVVAATGSTCTSQTGTNYSASYDAHGNMTSRAVKSGSSLDTQTLSFDGQDHLMRWNDTVTTSNEEWYMYDASGNRVLQRSTTGSGSSNTTITVYPFGLEEHLYNGAGTLTGSKYYYSLGGHLLGKTSGSGAPIFYLTDMLGSPLASFSGATGTSAVSGNQTYGPYGNVQYNKGLMGTAKSFTGQYKDDLSGLNDFGARYYDQLVGTFLSADTVQGNLLGDDPYAYVSGNPENFSDPTGQIMVSSCYSQGCAGYAIPKITSTTTVWSSALAGLFRAVTAGVGGSGHTSSKTAGVGDANNGIGPACTIGCRSNIFVDNGSHWVPVTSVSAPPPCLSLGGLGLPGCISTGGVSGISFIRVNLPPSTFNYCPPPVGCGDEGSKDSSLEDGSNKESTIFADATAGPDGEPQNLPTENAQANAGEAGTPTDTNTSETGNTNKVVPGDYLRKSTVNKAPMLSPGNRVLRGVYINDLGVGEPWIAIYDEYGRLMGRTDVTWGNRVAGIEPIHHHIYTYIDNLGVAVDGVYGVTSNDHLPGVFDPFN